jgi:hypothetical protein
MFTFKGWYYDPGSTDFEYVTVSWAGVPAVPYIDSTPLNPTTSQVKGPYFDITVTDTALDVMITSDPYRTIPSLAGRVLDCPVVLNVKNLGFITYTNVVLQIETNTATSPFLNVVTPAATLSEPAYLSYVLGDEENYDVTLNVNLKSDADLGVFMVPVTITAVNYDLKEAISSVITARITIAGVGPQIEVTSVTPEKISPGEAFTLTLVLTNVGDDTARNIVLRSGVGGVVETTVDGNFAVPEAESLPIFLGDLAPGASLTVDIPMLSNSDLSDGHVYSMDFDVYYSDSLSGYPTSSNIAVSVKSTGNGGSVLATYYWTMIVLAIIIAIFLMIVAFVYVKKNKTPKAAPVHDYNPQNQPPPPPMNQ